MFVGAPDTVIRQLHTCPGRNSGGQRDCFFTIWLAEVQVEVTTFTFRWIQQSDIISTSAHSCLYLKKQHRAVVVKPQGHLVTCILYITELLQ
jgi:hypothetical protein